MMDDDDDGCDFVENDLEATMYRILFDVSCVLLNDH
jgi:hypothetical protein